MKTLKFILIISALLVTLFCNNSFAEEKLKLKLTRPPLNELRANNMWDFSIKNLTQGDLEFTLNGTLKESKAGLIAKGQTVPIKIKKGETIQFKISDLPKTPDIEYVHPDQRYKDALIRAGNLPEGNYEICIFAKQSGTGEEIGSDCIEQEISKILEGDLTLLTPENGAMLEEKETPIFSWMANGLDKDASFTLEIYEMSSGEKGEDAVKSGKSFYKTETKQTKVTYNGPKFTNGKQYAWVVRSGSSRSNVSTFITSSAIQVRCAIDSVTCTGKAGEYRIVFKVCIDNDNSAFATANLQNILFSSNCMPATSAVSYSISNYKVGSTSVTLPQTIIRPSTGSNCLNLSAIVNTSPASTISALEIKAMLTYDNYPTDPSAVVYPPSGVFSGIIACPCCQNFKATINNPVVHGSGNNFVFESNISSTGGPYTKVTSELVYFALNPTSNGTHNDTCLNCTKDSKLMGNFTGGTLAGFNLGGLVGSAAGGFSRGIEFVSATSAGVDLTSGKDIKINFLGPNIKSLSCCSFQLYYCIRLSFTNTNCQTCDTLICGSYDVKSRGQFENLENGPKGQGERSISQINEGNNIDTLNIEKMTEFDELRIKNYIKRLNIDAAEEENYIQSLRTKIQINKDVLSQAVLPYNCPPVDANICVNGDFENGYNHWSCGYGTNTGLVDVQNNLNSLVAGALPLSTTVGTTNFEISLETSGTDYNVSTLQKVHSGNNSIRLGKPSAIHNGVELLSRTFNVTKNNTSLTFWYALVMQNPSSHLVNDIPFFLVRIKDQNCNVQTVSISPNIFPISSNNILLQTLSNGLKWKDWDCATIDLSSYWDASTNTGQQITVEFVNADCNLGGHYSYVYLDDVCLSCSGSSSGSIDINSLAKPCGNLPLQVCGNYTLPILAGFTGGIANTNGIVLTMYHNGTVLNTFTNYSLTGTNGYCFTLTAADFPAVTSPSDGYDFKVEGNFVLTNNSTNVVTPLSTIIYGNNSGFPGSAQNDDFLLNCTSSQNDCCKDFKTKIETENFSAGLPSAEATVYSFTPKFTVGPNPIRKVSMVMEYMNVSYEDRDCYVCAQNPLSYGNFFCRTESATLGNIKPSCPVNIWGLGIGREIVWGNNSSSINLTSGVTLGDVIYLFFPPSSTLKCCKPKFEFCIRYKFTDINCRTCETLVCYTIENGKLNPPSLRTEQKGNLKMEEIIKVQKELNQNKLSK